LFERVVLVVKLIRTVRAYRDRLNITNFFIFEAVPLPDYIVNNIAAIIRNSTPWPELVNCPVNQYNDYEKDRRVKQYLPDRHLESVVKKLTD
jgi:hypothetical protein